LAATAGPNSLRLRTGLERGECGTRGHQLAGKPEPRSTAPGSGRSSPRRASAGCCAVRRRPPAPARPPPAGTRNCPCRGIDFAAFPARADARLAGLLLAVPDLVSLDLPGLITAVGYPGTSVIPAVSWLLSLLALKLTGTRRVSHVDDLIGDPASALFAGLAVLPKKSALTDYSYRLAHDHQQRFLAALDTKMISAGLATASEAIFDLDFHAVMHWGHDPVLESTTCPPGPSGPARC